MSADHTQLAPDCTPAFAGSASYSYVLLRRAKEGDGDALNELFGRYYDRVLRIARIRIGAKLRLWLDEDDVTNDAFLRACHALAKFEPQGEASIIRWLTTLLLNAVRDASRRHSAATPLTLVEPPLIHAESAAERSSLGPARQAEAAEDQEIYDSCVRRLDDVHRKVILLRDYEGSDWNYIAERLGRPTPEAARELYRRARLDLATLLHRRLYGSADIEGAKRAEKPKGSCR